MFTRIFIGLLILFGITESSHAGLVNSKSRPKKPPPNEKYQNSSDSQQLGYIITSPSSKSKTVETSCEFIEFEPEMGTFPLTCMIFSNDISLNEMNKLSNGVLTDHPSLAEPLFDKNMGLLNDITNSKNKNTARFFLIDGASKTHESATVVIASQKKQKQMVLKLTNPLPHKRYQDKNWSIEKIPLQDYLSSHHSNIETTLKEKTNDYEKSLATPNAMDFLKYLGERLELMMKNNDDNINVNSSVFIFKNSSGQIQGIQLAVSFQIHYCKYEGGILLSLQDSQKGTLYLIRPTKII